MDPAAIDAQIWSEIGSLLRNLWLVVLFVILFAANMLIGHNFIPSFYASGHISNTWQKARLIFYAGAIISILLAVYFLIQVIDRAGVLRDFWPVYFY